VSVIDIAVEPLGSQRVAEMQAHGRTCLIEEGSLVKQRDLFTNKAMVERTKVPPLLAEQRARQAAVKR
jgi:hypothetical protein